MKTATVRDLRNHFAKVSRWLANGEKVEITSRGVPLAQLVPLDEALPKPRKRFDIVAHKKWMKETFKGKKLKGNSVLIMREGAKW